MKRVAPAPTDEQLFAAEQTDIIRRRDLEAANADTAEQERLALAGEPESEAMTALKASASVLSSRPVRGDGPNDDDSSSMEAGDKAGNGNRAKRQRNVRTSAAPRLAERTRKTPPAPPPPQEEIDPEDDQKKQDDKAYKLMDTAYRKWGVAAKKDLRKANRELAIDLGKDTALYLRSGIIRLADLHAAIDRLTATKAGEKDRDEDADDFETELETMRSALRGGS